MEIQICCVYFLFSFMISGSTAVYKETNSSADNITIPMVQDSDNVINITFNVSDDFAIGENSESWNAENVTGIVRHQPNSSNEQRDNFQLNRERWSFNEEDVNERSRLLPRIIHSSQKTFTAILAHSVQRMINNINCRFARRYFTDEGKCETVQQTPFNQMRFYVTPPRINTVYSAVIPEGHLKDQSSHHSVAVVDPFPRASFGHLVLIFYVDGATRPWCRRQRGLEIGSGLCLTQARRGKCRNFFRSNLSPDDLAKKCEINFIPLVYDERTEETGVHARKQLLECIPYIAGFGRCPKKVVTESTIVENCELIENTRRCYTKKLSSPRIQFPPLCRLYATCDHAVTLFGGWNDVTMMTRNEDHLRSFYDMLRRNGFRKNNIQIFYNGNGDVQVGEPYRHGLPASDKHRVRNHITTLCRTDLCVDSFVIYLNGPTTSDGSVLLWDNDGNGEADSSELYTIREFLDDITNCDANHVFIFADQSYSGLLASALRQRIATADHTVTSWDRVVLIASGDSWDYSWGRDITSHWSRLSPMHHVSFAYEGLGFVHSHPSITQRRHAEDYTLFGAPISEGLPLLSDDPVEMRRQYMGCQTLPAPQWMIAFLHNFDSENS